MILQVERELGPMTRLAADLAIVRGARRAAFAAPVALMAVLSLAGLAGSARSQPAAAPAKNANFGSSNMPYQIDADQLEVIDAENRAIWKGNAVVVQGTTRMTTPLLNVYSQRNGAPATPKPTPAGGLNLGSIERMEADGPVYYTTPQQTARGDHATYMASEHSIVMTGNVVLVQDKNVLQGGRLVIDTDTNHSQLYPAEHSGTTSGRVRGVFYPSQNQAQAQGAASATPAKR